MENQEVTAAELAEWLALPVTKCFRACLRRRLKECLEEFRLGHLVHADPNATHSAVVKCLGAMEVYEALLTLDEEDIND